jgi:hypothetical protein
LRKLVQKTRITISAVVTVQKEEIKSHHHGGSSAPVVAAHYEAVLVHDPVSLGTLGRLAPVEHEGLLDSDVVAGRRGGREDGLVGAGGLPVARPGGAVGAGAVGVLAVPRAEEVPLVLSEQGFGCTADDYIELMDDCSQLSLITEEIKIKQLTRKVPWVALVDVGLGDDRHGAWSGGGLVHEVMDDELLVCGVEPETSWKTRHPARHGH